MYLYIENGGTVRCSSMTVFLFHSQDLGPTISYLDNRLCLVVVSWYTYYACGTDAVQSTGCTLTSANGQSLASRLISRKLTERLPTSMTTPTPYSYVVRVNTQCGILDSNEVRVAQIDYQNHGVCRSLGGGGWETQIC